MQVYPSLAKTVTKLHSSVSTFVPKNKGCQILIRYDFFLTIILKYPQWWAYSERTKQMEPILNLQVLAEGLELVILLHTQY